MALSSFQYLENPYVFAEKMIDFDFKYIIIDRTPYFKKKIGSQQKVNPKIYDVSYPAWIINENKFIKIFESKYDLITDWQSPFGDINLRGLYLKRNKDD